MAFLKDGYDDLGIKIKSRSELMSFIDANTAVDYTSKIPKPNVDDDSYFERLNDLYFQYNNGLLRGKERLIPKIKSKEKPKESELKHYGVTLTTQVTKGKPRKGYEDFISVLKRIREFKGVTKIDAWFELTQAGALHVHCNVLCDGFLDAGKVRRANGNERIDQKLNKGIDKIKANYYMTKDIRYSNDKECLELIQKTHPHILSTKLVL